MSDDDNSGLPAGASAAAGATAGGLLREARLARGLHIAALATAIKVLPSKLESLEANRFDELPGAAFTRALAQTVCRFLKVDAQPVLALLPPSSGHGLERMSSGLNEPFREKPGRRAPRDWQVLKNPVLLGAIFILLAATVVWMIPRNWFNFHLSASARPQVPASAPASFASAGSASPGEEAASAAGTAMGEAVPTIVETTGVEPGAAGTASAHALARPSADAVLPPPTGEQPASAPVVAAPAPQATLSGGLRLSAGEPTWVQITDKRGESLLSRHLEAGEAVALSGTPPLRVKIGNASGAQLSYNGESVDLAPVTSRRNVASIELK